MNYILIATDKHQTDTVFLKQIAENCYLKITEVRSKTKPIPYFEFTQTNCVEHEFDPAYQLIKDPEEVLKIENRMVSTFMELFPKWN